MPSHKYTAGITKEYIRDNVFFFLQDCKHVLTLPNLYFGLEKKLTKEGVKVDCAEYKVNTFKQQQKIAPDNITLFYNDVKDIDVTKYDGIFLDLCGTFNKSADAVLKRINYGTKISITFLMARENKVLQQKIDIKNREDSYINLLREYNLFVTKYINYNNTGNSPMCVFFGEKKLKN